MIDVFILRENQARYKQLLDLMVEKTPYHELKYLLAEECAEQYPCKIFFYEKENKIVMFPSIIRKINDMELFSNMGEIYYDMLTPHEYSGALSNSQDKAVLEDFYYELQVFCKNHNIISQFIRFNPYLNDWAAARMAGYELNGGYEQVYIDLTKTRDQLLQECTPSGRGRFNKAKRAGVTFDIKINEHCIDRFKELYKTAMDLLGSTPFFYFSEDYFDNLLVGCSNSMLLNVKNAEGAIIASSIILLSDDVAYYHLGAYDRTFNELCPMDFLFQSAITVLQSQNVKRFHLGGGHESLLIFKGKFSSSRVNYYCGRKVYSEEIYEKLCAIWRRAHANLKNIDYFPIYRYAE